MSDAQGILQQVLAPGVIGNVTVNNICREHAMHILIDMGLKILVIIGTVDEGGQSRC